MTTNLKCVSIHSLYENAYDTDTMTRRVQTMIHKLNPDVVFVATENDILPAISTIVQYIKSFGTKVGIISDKDREPYYYKNNLIDMYPDYFVYKTQPRKPIQFIDAKIISKVYDNITPDYVLEESGPTEPNGFCMTDTFDNITNVPFCVKALDTNYEHNFLTDDFMEKWNKF